MTQEPVYIDTGLLVAYKDRPGSTLTRSPSLRLLGLQVWELLVSLRLLSLGEPSLYRPGYPQARRPVSMARPIMMGTGLRRASCQTGLLESSFCRPGHRQALRPINVTRPMMVVSWPRPASCLAGHALLLMGLPGYDSPNSSPQVNLDSGFGVLLF